MSVNRDRPHVMVLPEDDANRELANGFHLGCGAIRQFQVLPPAGGWRKVREVFVKEHAVELRRYPLRHIVLLVDFDGDPRRREEIVAEVPAGISGRVFVLGVLGEPEELRKLTGSTFESLGFMAASECRDNTTEVWGNEQLRHNEPELARMREHLWPILFSPA